MQRTRNEVIWVSERDVLSVCGNPPVRHLRERVQGRSSRWAPPTSYTNASPVVRMVFEPAKQSRALTLYRRFLKWDQNPCNDEPKYFVLHDLFIYFFFFYFILIVLEPTEMSTLGNPEGHKRSGARTYRSTKRC